MRRWIRAFATTRGGSGLNPSVPSETQGFTPTSSGLWRRFRRHRLAAIGLVVLLIFSGAAIGAPWLAPADPFVPFRGEDSNYLVFARPTAEHPLGTDALGRDVLSRLLFAARVSLPVGLLSVLLAAVVGSLIGAVAGFNGGWVDNVLMRVTDAVMAFPAMFLVMTLAAFVRPNAWNVVLVIGAIYWTGIARLVRGEVLRLKEAEYVSAAIGSGAKPVRIILRHLMPNAMGPLLVATTFGMAEAILIESALSFLGVGVQQPVASWGNMLSDATNIAVLAARPWLWLPPGLAILLTVLSINFVGDGLRDTLDPRSTTR